MKFILVHGAWHGGWCWTPLQEALKQRGHESVALDLPGHGTRISEISTVQLHDYAASVCEAAGTFSEPAVLVGHSMGGLVISAAAERCPAAFASMIFLAAFMPQDGESLFTLLQRYDLLPQDAPADGLNSISADAARAALYADCTAETADAAVKMLQPQPMAPLLEPLSLTSGRYGSIPKDYIVCTEDRSIDPRIQRQMLSRADIRQVKEIAASHSPFLSRPVELAEILIGLAEAPDLPAD